MASSSSSPRVICLFFFFVWFFVGGASAGDVLGLELHHRFSDRVRRWAESRSHDLPGGWPEKGTVDYYAALAGHDRSLRHRGRSLSDVAFADGNATFRINSLGFLHYAVVALGTPNVTFLVALDTGSDLFWVPCDCTRCAPTDANSYGFNFDFSIYSPSMSSTSRKVPCNSSFCDHQNKCSGSSQCPYSVEYVSADTSSSGVLIKDVLYLTTEDTKSKVVKAPIIFGCGQVQTGSFLDSAAPNGLFGLGMNKISVPSTLSSAGFASDSFSMCFGDDGIGRISFGDNGSSDQQETQFNLRHSRAISTYNISITGMSLGESSINVDFSAIVDSGTSFTYLADPAYTSLSKSFDAQVQDKLYTANSSIPFEYCYYISSNESLNNIPDLNFTTKGGSKFPVNDPIVLVRDEATAPAVILLPRCCQE
ncbi:aspartyl protease family protein 1-like [Iris pallida]|uniref:Aspartyl protease family protein 1-like n=1 Tax=Iris pallida TaxID=29817 RepID=A0AAX6FK62_IRIPA|nr:aspartyl protease family protein 1-like [Iris pallida]KAJ6849530.1 aspartyl protease family protein 1-like [Iris pallida]